jgi:hypothetical protein
MASPGESVVVAGDLGQLVRGVIAVGVEDRAGAAVEPVGQPVEPLDGIAAVDARDAVADRVERAGRVIMVDHDRGAAVEEDVIRPSQRVVAGVEMDAVGVGDPRVVAEALRLPARAVRATLSNQCAVIRKSPNTYSSHSIN